MNKKIKNLSQQTKVFLHEGESEKVDFKKSPEGVTVDDLVAFANHVNGGSILVGIEEKADQQGVQLGTVVGCDVSDGAILQIVNKAISCIPPIAIDVFIENLDKKPVLRIDIPASETKPHSTPKGVYCCRDGSRNRPLHPTELLRIFLDNEGKLFTERFEQAADKITGDLVNLEENLKRSIASMSDQLGWTGIQFGDTESTLDSINRNVALLINGSKNNSSRLRALFKQDKREDPVINEAKNELSELIEEKFIEDPKIFEAIKKGQSFTVQHSSKNGEVLDQGEVQSVFRSTVKKIQEEGFSKKVKKK